MPARTPRGCTPTSARDPVRTAWQAQRGRYRPAAGPAACVGAFVGVAAADDEEDTGGDAGAAVEDVKETVAVGDSCGGEEAEPHPATPTARPANRQANRAARIWRIHVPLCPEPTAAQEARAISEESTVQWTSIAGSQSRLNLALSTMPETCDNSSLRSFPGIPGPATTQPCTQMAPSQKLRPGGRPESHRRTRGGPRPRRPVAQACLGRPSSRHAVGRRPCRPARAANPATSMSWRPNWAASPSTACAIATGWTSKTTHSRPHGTGGDAGMAGIMAPGPGGQPAHSTLRAHPPLSR